MNKFSIITINFNNRDGLQFTIDSIRSQRYKNFQFIIIDGGSSDGSLSIIENNSDIIDYSVSEKDSGVYNAMNKGIDVATGEYTIFMNSGDRFNNSEVLYTFSDISCDIAAGNTNCVTRNNGNVHLVKTMNVPNEMTARNIIGVGINHQSVFTKTCILKKHKFDENLRMVSDYKFFLNAFIMENCTYETRKCIVADYDYSGMTSQEQNEELMNIEREIVLKQLFPLRIIKDYKDYCFGSTRLEQIIYSEPKNSAFYKTLTSIAELLLKMQDIYGNIRKYITK